MIKRVALVGASSTGKTTVYQLLKDRLDNFTFIQEASRIIYDYGFAIGNQATSTSHLALSSKHVEDLITPGNLILDRCYMDLLVYSNIVTGIDAATHTYIKDTWYRIQDKYTHYIYFPIEFEQVDDGVRTINQVWRTKVDHEFKSLLQQVKAPYLTVTGSALDRVEQVLQFIK